MTCRDIAGTAPDARPALLARDLGALIVVDAVGVLCGGLTLAVALALRDFQPYCGERSSRQHGPADPSGRTEVPHGR